MKVGDKVKVVRNTWGGTKEVIGLIGDVILIDETRAKVKLTTTNDYYRIFEEVMFNQDELEVIK